MTDMIVREYRPEDIPALSALWARVFGDSVALIGDFFRLLPDMGTGLAAEADGEIAGAAYIITGMELADCGNRPPVCGYIYAVAVEERFRGLGLGGRLTLAAAEKGRERGASIICTLPAESALYNWYEKLLGVQCALSRAESRLPAAGGEPVMALSSTEYMLWRETMLRGRCRLRLSNPSLEFQRLLCREYGGGFFAAGGCVGAAYREGDEALIRELIGPEEARPRCAAAIAAHLGAKYALLYTPAPAGRPYIAALPGAIPPGCVWNLSFD